MQYLMNDMLMAAEDKEDIVELWRRGVLGDAEARRAYLRRTLPASQFAAIMQAEQKQAGQTHKERGSSITYFAAQLKAAEARQQLNGAPTDVAA